MQDYRLLKTMLGGHPDSVLAQCPLWLAQYGPSAVLPPGWSAWSLWQYTDGAQPGSQPVNGIGHCDRDRFNGGAADPPDFLGERIAKLTRHLWPLQPGLSGKYRNAVSMS